MRNCPSVFVRYGTTIWLGVDDGMATKYIIVDGGRKLKLKCNGGINAV